MRNSVWYILIGIGIGLLPTEARPLTGIFVGFGVGGLIWGENK